jgi:quercetin dioxygenase-like cupin family protein
MSDIDPDGCFADARSLRGRAGDILCWPAGHWHVGQADELSTALNLAIYPSREAEGAQIAAAVVK